MRKIIFGIFFYICVLGANDFEWVKAYQDGGAKAIESRVESILQTPEYWKQELEGKDVRFGYYQDLKFLFVATKNEPTLRLFELDGGKLQEKLNTQSLVGKTSGHKVKEGDLATPIGVYSLNDRLTGLDQYYGPLAYSTNYPNLYDRLQKRTGYGIWIHGMPLDGNRLDLNTRGCIAIENNLLSNIDKILNYTETLLITYENEAIETNRDDLSVILGNLFAWKNAWKNSEVDSYLSFYSKDFIRFDGMKYDVFSDNKKRIFAKKERKSIDFYKINISPYPNDENKKYFRISFWEDYKAPSYAFSGLKELYAELKDGKMQIFMER
ncbi:MAG: L,D-transpeptidase family protein [Helicobacter sp.]|nr:L,D-transpeptidase family protein [Helicobacter sp.]